MRQFLAIREELMSTLRTLRAIEVEPQNLNLIEETVDSVGSLFERARFLMREMYVAEDFIRKFRADFSLPEPE